MIYLVGSLASLGLFALFVASRPAAFRIARALTIDAPAERLFGLINDFHEWSAWSPWDRYDPTMTRTFEGPAAGKGAVYRWRGNNKVGEGSMTLIDSVTPSRVDITVAFLKPFAATNRAIFTLEPDGTGTKVTWAMEGENAFPAKLFGLFMNMDEMLGKDFLAGLTALRDAAAKQA